MNPATAALLPAWTLGQTAVEPFYLVSWWKAVCLLIPFIPWAYIVSFTLDKHAERFILPREKYNTIHLFVAFVAILVGFAMPFKGVGAFIVGLLLTSAILAADIAIFIRVHNKDDKVPAEHAIKLADLSKFRAAKAAKAKAKQAGKAELVIKGADKSTVEVADSESPEFAVRVAAEKIYLQAILARATQAEMMPAGKENAYQVRFLVDGVPVNGEPMAGAEAIKVMDFWKSAAKLDLADRRKKLTGDVTIEQGAAKKKVRITTFGTQTGMRLIMLMDPEGAVQRALPEMGLLESQAADLKTLTQDLTGVVLLAAPADMGRTTTLYTVLRLHDAYTQNVQTLEMEPQTSLEGIKQNKFDAAADGPEYGTTVRSILRRDPNVLGVAELPDAQTAKEVARADHDRTRVYLSARADSAIPALQGFVKLVGDPEAAAKGLRGVVGQKLIRKLCTNCRAAYTPSPEMLKKLGLPIDGVKQLYKRGGQVVVKEKPQTCPVCAGSGYVGQEGIFEVYPLGEAERALIQSMDWNGLKLELRRRKLPTIQQAALRKALDGITSVEEVLRVTTEQAAAPPAPATAPAPGPAASAKPQPARK